MSASAEPNFVPKRGRPTAKQVQAINRAILVAARDLFAADGYHGTPMEAVAARAGVSKGTLYARYTTKEELLRAVVQERVESWSAISSQYNDQLSDDLEQRLRYHARNISIWLGAEEVRAFTRVISGASEVFPELAQALHTTGYCFARDMLAREIREGTRNDPQPARDPEHVAEALMAVLYGWRNTNETVRTLTDQDATDFAERAVDLLIAGRAAW